ncbi:hypothetical protein ASQ49_06965 [Acidipropionibacterium acidipropionici]|nr:hypothetical protein ASQ49_06965 [Acidipropionibacterium acidipropionici]APZ09200.1 hypothetical protein BWX38_07965 [Acidipropionibacterium acidipropionici]
MAELGAGVEDGVVDELGEPDDAVATGVLDCAGSDEPGVPELGVPEPGAALDGGGAVGVDPEPPAQAGAAEPMSASSEAAAMRRDEMRMSCSRK